MSSCSQIRSLILFVILLAVVRSKPWNPYDVFYAHKSDTHQAILKRFQDIYWYHPPSWLLSNKEQRDELFKAWWILGDKKRRAEWDKDPYAFEHKTNIKLSDLPDWQTGIDVSKFDAMKERIVQQTADREKREKSQLEAQQQYLDDLKSKGLVKGDKIYLQRYGKAKWTQFVLVRISTQWNKKYCVLQPIGVSMFSRNKPYKMMAPLKGIQKGIEHGSAQIHISKNNLWINKNGDNKEMEKPVVSGDSQKEFATMNVMRFSSKQLSFENEYDEGETEQDSARMTLYIGFGVVVVCGLALCMGCMAFIMGFIAGNMVFKYKDNNN